MSATATPLLRLGARLRARGLQIAATFAVFAALLAVASGKLELLLDIGGGASNFGAIARTPEFVLLVVIGTLLSALLPLSRPLVGSLITLGCMLPVYWAGYRSIDRPLLPMEFSLLTILVLYVLHVIVSYYREFRSKQQVVALFRQYVPPELANRMSRDPRANDLTGEARELTILFCDVKGFARHSERLEPRELGALLNALLTPLTAVVHRNQGTIDKYMGDGLMAFWGAPLPDPHHAAHAVAAAFELQDAVGALASEFERRGWPALSVGVGINTGTVHVGNMGSRYRMAYTAIGDAVNVASRLEALTRVFNVGIIVGEGTRRQFAGAVYRELGLVQVKGKQDFTRIYEPLHPDLDPESTALSRLDRHNRALAAYYARDWDRAERGFHALLEERPNDPLYDYYLQRIRAFRTAAPAADWRGELRFTVS